MAEANNERIPVIRLAYHPTGNNLFIHLPFFLQIVTAPISADPPNELNYFQFLGKEHR